MEKCAYLFCKLSELLEEFWRCMIVASFCLDRLDYYTGYRNSFLLGVLYYKTLDLGQTTIVLLLILANVFLQRILIDRERCYWPIEGRNVDFVDIFAMSGWERTESSTMKSTYEKLPTNTKKYYLLFYLFIYLFNFS